MTLRTAARRVFLGVLCSLPCAPTAVAADFDPGRSALSVAVDDLKIPYREFALFVMPGKDMRLTSGKPLAIEISGGSAKATARGWVWTAPDRAGWYTVQLKDAADSMHLNVFVMRPASDVRNGMLGDYRIGAYSRSLFRSLPAYKPPTGFVEVQEAFADLQVSPHFRLGQFLSKQASGWPKYLVLRPELIIKLERILEHLNLSGIDADGLVVMSGFRTPWYNRAIGNRTTHSRHLYGGAADIFIDVGPRDGVMDDLNKDGRIDKADANHLYDLLDSWREFSWWQKLTGGLAAYGSTQAHGPFVHVDARGYRARWGRSP